MTLKRRSAISARTAFQTIDERVDACHLKGFIADVNAEGVERFLKKGSLRTAASAPTRIPAERNCSASAQHGVPE